MKKIIIFSLFILFFTSCNKASSKGVTGFTNLSQLPDLPLTQEQISTITHDCLTFGEIDTSNLEVGCILFSMNPSDFNQAINVDIEDFSEQDLMLKLAVLFTDVSEAPTIIIEGDGVLEEGLTNPGFNLILR